MEYSREQVIEILRNRLEDYIKETTTKAREKNKYACPFCPSSDGLYYKSRAKRVSCYACGKGGEKGTDIFGYAAELNGICSCGEEKKYGNPYFNKVLSLLCDYFGYTVEGQYYSDKRQTQRQKSKALEAAETAKKEEKEKEKRAKMPKRDYTSELKEWASQIEKTDYHRGLTSKTLERFRIGFAKQWGEEWDGEKKEWVKFSDRLIIPYDKYHYMARLTEKLSDEKEEKERRIRYRPGSETPPLYNYQCLERLEGPVFVTEGEIDALSIMDFYDDEGKQKYAAVALGGLNGSDRLIEAVKKTKHKGPFLLLFDNEKTAEKYEKARSDERATIKKLQELGVSAFSVLEQEPTARDFFQAGGYKDCNDFLNGDRETLDIMLTIVSVNAENGKYKALEMKDEVKQEAPKAPKEPETLEPAPDPEEKDSKTAQEQSQDTKTEEAPQPPEPQLQSASEQMGSYLENIAARANQQELKTGFALLDDYLNGGLHPGLYTFGAVSSLGKTALILQIADTVANPKDKDSAAAPVLIFSLEMGRDELIARSISRETFLLAANPKNLKGWKVKDAKTTSEILNQARRLYTVKELDLIDQATKNYRDGAGKNIYIVEGVGDIGSKQITETVKSFIGKTGKKPLVIIDYLQLIAPADVHFSDKQNTDRAVLELKRLSRDADIPIICISSFNRESYNEPVSLASFKESGAIEYTSSVVIGLQENGLGWRDIERKGEEKEETDKARNQRIRRLREENKQKAGEGEPIEIQLEILKNRDGRKGNLLLYFYAKYNTYTARVSNQKEANAFEPTWKKKLAEEEELLENVPMTLPF